MGKKGKDKTKKNKGPKGKKARAKMKLQRQWGEEAKSQADQGLSQQRGSNRLVSRKEKFPRSEEPSENEEFNQNLMVHSSDSEAEEDEEDTTTDVFLDKLSTLHRGNKNGEEDDESEMEPDEDENDAKGQSSAMNTSMLDMEEEGENADISHLTPVDLFSERFSHSMDSTSTANIADQVKEAHVTSAVDTSVLGLESGMELQVSSNWLKRHDLLDTPASLKNWNTQAQAAFGSHRDFLKQAWRSSSSNSSSRSLWENPAQRISHPLLSSYLDMLLAVGGGGNVSYKRRRAQRESITRATTLHILNHVWTSRLRISKHNKRLQQDREESDDKDGNDKEEKQQSDVFRDQGYTRPTVLVLLPTRGECFEFVKGLQALLSSSSSSSSGDVSIANWDRFQQEYGPPPPDENEEDDETEQRRRQVLSQKGKDWLELFGDNANHDDDFKLGLSINVQAPKKQQQQQQQSKSSASATGCALRLFSDFYKSDIIVASPLGLKIACTQKGTNQDGEEENEEDDSDGTPQADFLSSIEICLLNRCDVLLMQNWDHVNDMLKLVNQQPTSSTHTDFSRVRNYFLDGHAAHWRQLIMTSEWVDPMILSTFKRFASSRAGVARLRQRTLLPQASISRVMVNVRQVFSRIPCHSLLNQTQDKVDYFAKHLLAEIRQRQHVLIFIPSYFDFVGLRNLLLKREVDFVSVTEYSRTSEVSRGRARFLQGRKSIMLYTGRAHFFLHHKIRGVRHIIFLGLPECPAFFADHVNDIESSKEDDSGDKSCLALFTKYEAHALERIVGRENCKRMVSGEKHTFLFDS